MTKLSKLEEHLEIILSCEEKNCTIPAQHNLKKGIRCRRIVRNYLRMETPYRRKWG